MRFSALLSAVAVTSVLLTACACHSPHSRFDSNSRTLSVSANESVIVEPDLAILHIGFDTPPEDLKSAYADGAHRSNAIIAAVKQGGIQADAIRSECQYLERDWGSQHKFRLAQQWTVKVAPQRASEILDIAISAGANSSGQIEWTVKDPKSLDDEALDRASARANEKAAVLAKGMGAHLGTLINASNQISVPQFPMPMMQSLAYAGVAKANTPPPLVIEPHQVSREATVYAVFAIE